MTPFLARLTCLDTLTMRQRRCGHAACDRAARTSPTRQCLGTAPYAILRVWAGKKITQPVYVRLPSGYLSDQLVLGLFLGRQLAQAMAGYLDLEDTGPQGSTFCLRLPVRFAKRQGGSSRSGEAAGCAGSLQLRQTLATSEARVCLVPESHGLFLFPPAQVDHAPLAQAGKVDERRIKVLDLHTKILHWRTLSRICSPCSPSSARISRRRRAIASTLSFVRARSS